MARLKSDATTEAKYLFILETEYDCRIEMAAIAPYAMMIAEGVSNVIAKQKRQIEPSQVTSCADMNGRRALGNTVITAHGNSNVGGENIFLRRRISQRGRGKQELLPQTVKNEVGRA